MSGLLHAGSRPAVGDVRRSGWTPHLRKVRFAMVGAVCFGIQYVALRSLVALGVGGVIANGVGFALSAQVNFMLSSLVTWRDRWRDFRHIIPQLRWHQLLNSSPWLSYNAVAAVALVVNIAVFASTFELVGALLAAGCGVAAGAVVTYLVCDRLVFAAQKVVLQEVEA